MNSATSAVGLFASASVVLCVWGCASAVKAPIRGGTNGARGASASGTTPVALASQPASQPAAKADPLTRLRELVAAELAHPEMKKARLSLLVAPLTPAPGGGDPIISMNPDARRVPASNAKLLTTTAAALALGGAPGFITRVYAWRPGGPLYLRGTGDPVLSRADLAAMARAVKAGGVLKVRGVVVDDSYFDARRLAPGFQSFSEGVHYRPTSGALNVDGNVVVILVSAPRGRRRPRVDVFPPSDYVKVRKRVRFSRGRRGPGSRKSEIKIETQAVNNIMWLNISGTMGRRARTFSTRRAVYDPALNAGWAFRRALVEAGVEVLGSVRRGRVPARAKGLAARRSAMSTILGRTNRHSNNLAAENLVRLMGIQKARTTPGARNKGLRVDTWKAGLVAMKEHLAKLGVTEFWLGNGSGLHRGSWVTARTMVTLLQRIHGSARLRKLLLPSLAVAGRSGTLAGRMRKTHAAGFIRAKTGTLSGALALSGYVDPEGKRPLVFSLLVNGRSDRVVRDRMDRLAVLLARYSRGMKLVEEVDEERSSKEQGTGEQGTRNEEWGCSSDAPEVDLSGEYLFCGTIHPDLAQVLGHLDGQRAAGQAYDERLARGKTPGHLGGHRGGAGAGAAGLGDSTAPLPDP